ncbi:uncharacterized protein LOC135488437 isoform X2 [Lineus longissimus]|uniref:uncharacterized protein LOC135488437 isoform X2 n=1 Tax=Lineus longissimus TaxID=88925 RepID=UPI00315CAD1A
MPNHGTPYLKKGHASMGNQQGKDVDEVEGALAHWTAGEDVVEGKFEEKVVHGLPNHVFSIFERNIRSLPYKNITRQDIVKLASQVDRLLVEEPRDIIIKGEPSDGVYILIDGEAVVVSESAEVTLFNISPGDFFGEISCLFGVPATARVKIPSCAILLFVQRDHFSKFKRDESVGMLDWYVKRRYLATDKNVSLNSPWNISKDAIEKKTVKEAIQTWPLFSGWSEEALDTVVRTHSMGSLNAKLILYPPKSTIVFCGDPANDLILLIRGKADVVDKSLKNSMVIQARKYPFVLGEEGLFIDRTHVLTVKAKTGCVVAHVGKDAILKAKDMNLNGSNKVWQEATKRWQRVFDRRDAALYNKYKVYLQIEVLYKMFREKEIFLPLPIGFSYHISLQAVAFSYKAKQVCLTEEEYEKKCCFMVMVGKCSLASDENTIMSYSQGDVFWRTSWMPKKATVIVDSVCLVVKVPYSAFQEGLKKYPGTKIVEPERPVEPESEDVISAGTSGI